ncbi:hypothetical protein MA16_Dca011015 [Dendrobium catenatum]|uniref:Sn1-specific diacylglycerol lipase n=1 Tax=Dendrobium catenatum TaxID=906689 RepID=A0A2I0WCD7_9ASPA|nr:hypothetical protein MA16_Dca011015 [Dendrobium catenatum]
MVTTTLAVASTATAAGVAMLLCIVLNRPCMVKREEDGDEKGISSAGSRSREQRSREAEMERRLSWRPAEPPSTWQEAVATVAETIRFTYSETLGRWPIGDLAFGIRIHMRKQLLKPAFTILRDKSSKCILLIVRGLHSIKDTLTAAIGLVVPFHHSILDEFGITKVVSGYAHYGMVSAAHWIAKCATPYILKAVEQYPAYKFKIVGNSLGAGIAAILTYILHEHKDFASATCIAFAPAACMTWDLAESGQNFITTIINGSDMVPTFSLVSADNLRLEVAASSWLNDLRDQMHQPFTSCAQTISSKSQNLLRNAQQAVLTFARCMDCLGILSCHEEKIDHQGRNLPIKDMDSSVIKQNLDEIFAEQIDHTGSCSNQYYCNGTEEDASMQPDKIFVAATEEEMIERELWLELGKELQRQQEASGASASEDRIDEEKSVYGNIGSKQPVSAEEIHFFPPGRIRHLVAEQVLDANSGKIVVDESNISMYETPRHLYGKIRLSPNMIKDHYMPVYKKMIELMIENLKKKEST